MLLRNNWQKLFKKVQALLKSSSNPVDMTTWKTLSTNKVKILPYYQVDKNDFSSLLKDYAKKVKTKLPAHYPPARHITKKLEECWDACIYENRIYIRSDLKNAEKMKRVIVHEINHFINDSEKHYKSPADGFREELRAFTAEKMSANGPLTRLHVKKRAQKIAKNYSLPLPEKIQLPSGLYYEVEPLAKNKIR